MQGLLSVCQSYVNHNLLIVGHGGIFTFGLPCVCPEVSLAEVVKSDYHNASISEIDVRVTGNQFRGTLIEWANNDHLSGQAAELIPGLPALGDLP